MERDPKTTPPAAEEAAGAPARGESADGVRTATEPTPPVAAPDGGDGAAGPEAHADEDRRLRELAEARNNGENAAYQAERQLKDLAEQVDPASKEEIETAIKDVRESLTSEDPNEINAKTEALQSAFHKVSEAMYERAQQQQAASDNGASENGAQAEEEDVVDAEVVDEGKS